MRILIADDDRLQRTMLEEILVGWGHEAIAVTNGDEARRVLQMASAPPLAILDWALPGMDGPRVCQELRRNPAGAYTYVILLTARNDLDDALAGLHSGADDFLVKPIRPVDLKARLRTALRVLDLQQSLGTGLERSGPDPGHDSLTELCSRRGVVEALRRELARADRMGARVGLLLADIDHFNEINEAHGHLAGDAVLREVARRLYLSVRAYDTVGRLGEDQFLIVLPGCDAVSSMRVADRVRAYCACRPIEIGDRSVWVTLSVGAVIGRDPVDCSAEDLLRSAGVALDRAKAGGRDRSLLVRAGAAREALEAPAGVERGQ